jgi:hypothetical protein
MRHFACRDTHSLSLFPPHDMIYRKLSNCQSLFPSFCRKSVFWLRVP